MEQELRTLRRRRGVRARPASLALARLSGGASQETWSFDIVASRRQHRRDPAPRAAGLWRAPTRAAGLDAEAALMQLAHDAGVPSPRVLHVLQPQDELGTGFIMARVEGETIARKILRDEQFAKARPILARQLGKRCWPASTDCHWRNCLNFAQMTATKKSPSWNATTAVSTGRGRCSNWRCAGCATTIPVRPAGDAGARRFPPRQSHHRPRRRARGAGLGTRAYRRSHGGSGLDLRQFLALRRDRQAGRRLWHRARSCSPDMKRLAARVDPARVMFWEVMGTLRWGVMCCGMMQRFRLGPDHSMERAMIGRRSSETEIDLLRLLRADRQQPVSG